MEEPPPRIEVAVIARAHGDGHDVAEGGAQPADLVVGEGAGATARIDARLIEHLVGDPVADAGGERLVEQQRLHRRRARADERGEVRRRRQLAEGIEAEQADWRLPLRIITEPHATEPAGVRVGELAAIVELHPQLHEPRRPGEAGAILAMRDQAQGAATGRMESAGHPEMQARPRAAVELEPEMLAVSPHGPHAPPQQRAPPARRRHALEHDRIVGALDLDDAPPARHALDDPARGLDLGQLRHWRRWPGRARWSYSEDAGTRRARS